MRGVQLSNSGCYVRLIYWAGRASDMTPESPNGQVRSVSAIPEALAKSSQRPPGQCLPHSGRELRRHADARRAAGEPYGCLASERMGDLSPSVNVHPNLREHSSPAPASRPEQRAHRHLTALFKSAMIRVRSSQL
jgi:hypothetical protein